MYAELRLRTGSTYSTSTILRNVSALTFDSKNADVGALTFSLPVADATALGVGMNSVIEVAPNSKSYKNLWFGLDGAQGSQTVDGANLTQFSGKSIVQWLTDCIVYPSTWPAVPTQNPDGTTATVIQGHSFENATPGNIIRTLVARGVQRGGLAWLDVSTFTGTTTSSSTAWSTTLTTTYTNGTTLLQVLQDLSNRHLVDFSMQGMSLRLDNPGVQSTSFTVDQVLFRRGKEILEQTRTQDASDAGSTVLIIGDESAIKEITDPALLASIGRRREKFVSQGGITDIPTLQLLGTAELSISGHVKVEDTLGIWDADILPWANFNVGDWVWADFDGTLKNIQVQQIAAQSTDANNLTLGLTLGDRIEARDEKNQRLIDNITGQNAGSYGGLPNQQDYKAPGNPSTVISGATAYRDANGHDACQVTITWVSPTLNADGTAMHDLDRFEVKYQVGGAATWSAGNPVSADATPLAAYVSSLPVGKSFLAAVRAVDSDGNASAWVNSNTIAVLPRVLTPPNPVSTPTIISTLQSVKISWDGKDNVGNPYDSSLFYVQVHLGTSSGFTPTTATQVGTLSSAGTVTVTGLDPAVTYYAKLIAVDKSSNFSPVPSAPSNGDSPATLDISSLNLTSRDIGGMTTFTQSTTPTGAITGDLWIDTANGNVIKRYNGTAWVTYQLSTGGIATGAVGSTQIASGAITATQIAAGTITGDRLVAGAITSTQIATGTITAVQIAVGAITASMIATGTLGADIVLGARIKTANSGARVELNSAGVYAYNSVGAQTFGASSVDGAVVVTGQIQGGSIKIPVAAQPSPGYLSVDSNGLRLTSPPAITTNTVPNPNFSNDTNPLSGVAMGTGTCLVDDGAPVNDFNGNVDYQAMYGKQALKAFAASGSAGQTFTISLGSLAASTQYTVSWHTSTGRVDGAGTNWGTKTYGNAALIKVQLGSTAMSVGIDGYAILPSGGFPDFYAGTISTGTTITSYGNWQVRYWATFNTTSAGTYTLQLPYPLNSDGTVDYVHSLHVGAVQCETGSFMTRYFDGETNGGAWTGTASASASTRAANYQHVNFPTYADPYFSGTQKIDQLNTRRIKIGSANPHGSNYVQMSRSTAASIANATWGPIPWDDPVATDRIAKDDGAVFGGAFGAGFWTDLLAPVSGMYYWSIAVTWTYNTTGIRCIQVRRNTWADGSQDGPTPGYLIAQDFRVASDWQTYPHIQSFSGQAYMGKNSNLHFEIRQNTGASLNLLAGGRESPFQVVWGMLAAT